MYIGERKDRGSNLQDEAVIGGGNVQRGKELHQPLVTCVKREGKVGGIILDVGGKEAVLAEHGQHELQHLGGVVLKDAPVVGSGLTAGQLQNQGVDGLSLHVIPALGGEPGGVTAVEKEPTVPFHEKDAGDLVGHLGYVIGEQGGDLVAADLIFREK